MKKNSLIILTFFILPLLKLSSQNASRVDRLVILESLDYSLGQPVEIGQHNGQTLYRTSYTTTGRCKPPGRIFCRRNAGCCWGGSADHYSDGTIVDVRVNGNVGQLYRGQDADGDFDVFYCNDCQ